MTQTMVKLTTLLEQHLDSQPPTVVMQATTWWETVLACVKLQECGLGVNPPAKVSHFNLPYLEQLELQNIINWVSCFIHSCPVPTAQ